MAYMNQERKRELAALCKKALAKFPGVKWTLAVRHHSTIVLTIASGDIDFQSEAREGIRFDGGSCDVNRHCIERDWTGRAREFLSKANEALSTGNFDKSDIQTDYFNVGWYVDLQIGRWDKAYVLTGREEARP